MLRKKKQAERIEFDEEDEVEEDYEQGEEEEQEEDIPKIQKAVSPPVNHKKPEKQEEEPKALSATEFLDIVEGNLARTYSLFKEFRRSYRV